MKLATFVTALTGLGFVTSSPVPTNLVSSSAWARLQRRAILLWEPSDAYKFRPQMRQGWGNACDIALNREGCEMGIIYQGVTQLKPPVGEKTAYINVDGASLLGVGNSKRMRVFQDGSSEDGWTARDQRLISEFKTPRPRWQLKAGPNNAPKNTHLIWDPPNAYQNQGRRKMFWEKSCDQALTRLGCGAGIIHRGETKLVEPNGLQTSYVRVEGAPDIDMKNSKRLRVFRDASAEEGWSREDRKLMMEAKLVPKVTLPPDIEGHRAPLSWEPANAYENQPRRRLYWEHVCSQALEKQGCGVGTIHKGESRLTKNGEKISYVRVRGASSMVDMEHGNTKRMLVFQDGSSEVGWSGRDMNLMAQSLRPNYGGKRKRPISSVDWSATTQTPTQKYLPVYDRIGRPKGPARQKRRERINIMAQVDASIGTQAPTEVHTQEHAEEHAEEHVHSLPWDTPHAEDYHSFFWGH